MMASAPASRPYPSHVVAGDTPAALAAIAEPQVTLALWERPTPVRIGRLDRFADLRITTDAGAVEATMLAAMRGPRGRWMEAVTTDAGRLTRLFADATGSERVEIRLDRIVGNACWRFHTDYVPIRLLSTYTGRGTQWLAQGAPDEAAAEMSPGHVGLFKGRLLAGEAAIVHRSPPIAETGEERLLLVIDPARPPA